MTFTDVSQITPLDADLCRKLARCGAANLSNILLKRGFRNTFLLGLRPISHDMAPMVGPAFTMRWIPAREDVDSMALYSREDSLHRRAIEECPPGAVLVMSTGSDSRASCMGDMMALRLKMRGVAGVVTDGGFRDAPGIRSSGLSCFERESSGPATPIWLHPTELNTPIGCAGVAIYPGDIIVGDGEGIVAIPRSLARDVAEEAVLIAEYEVFVAMHLRRGRSIFGLFPATNDSAAEYQKWLEDGRPDAQ
ncbi:ribonuclease activity regulator RraA [Bradyrhizobium manausense]|uniref:RraA family protein n=1 Tax=Bradyrhizobium manausense TaxID=989370 RepID=UPI001BA83416|nr:ribonuclease activity regulator RraA [Bradyrhizobium manausense]